MSPARRRIAVELPQESPNPGVHEFGFLKEAMRRTRDAPCLGRRKSQVCWLGPMEFVLGRGSPCNFCNDIKQLRVSMHGYDFAVLGSMLELKSSASGLKQRSTITERGIPGSPRAEGTSQEIRLLHRLFSWIREGVTWEPDPRHVGFATRGLGVTKKVTTSLTHEEIKDTSVMTDVVRELAKGMELSTFCESLGERSFAMCRGSSKAVLAKILFLILVLWLLCHVLIVGMARSAHGIG